AKSRAAQIVGAFRHRGLNAHHAGFHTDRDVVFRPDSIAVAHIYRAKGNEAPFVFVLDSDYASSRYGTSILGLASRRNKLFTAITRSRAWVRISGTGDGAKEIAAEVEKIRASGFELKFTIPDAEGLKLLRKVHRDITEAERNKLKKHKRTLEDI